MMNLILRLLGLWECCNCGVVCRRWGSNVITLEGMRYECERCQNPGFVVQQMRDAEARLKAEQFPANLAATRGMEAQCFDCKLPYEKMGVDLVLPDQQWKIIFPEKDGILCANCICKRVAERFYGGNCSAIYAWVS